MHTIWILTVILFLSGGSVAVQSVQAPNQEECEAARPIVEQQFQDKRLQVGDETVTVLDAETVPCQSVTKKDHA